MRARLLKLLPVATYVRRARPAAIDHSSTRACTADDYSAIATTLKRYVPTIASSITYQLLCPLVTLVGNICALQTVPAPCVMHTRVLPIASNNQTHHRCRCGRANFPSICHITSLISTVYTSKYTC